MRPGPPRGATVTFEVMVTPEMSARVGDTEVHAVYGTVSLVEHIEQVCRAVLTPHLEAGEEGVGTKLDILHRAPVPVGERLTLVATVATVAPGSLTCEVMVRHGGTIVARGSFEQRIVRSDAFQAEIEARRTAPNLG